MSQRFSEDFYRRSDEALEIVDRSEVETWLKHPCTQALRYALMGDFMGLYDSWGNGEFTKESVDGTVQSNAKALGQVQAIESMVDWIDGLLLTKEDQSND